MTPGAFPDPGAVVDVPGPWRHRRVSSNGARFHLAECGAGPLVLLLHGFPEFWWAWRHQLPVLAEAGWRAAAMDLRGYGGSDKTPRGYDPFTLAADVVGVIRSLGERRAVVVGHGWGGWAAWAAAALHPRFVRALAPVAAPHPRLLRPGLLADAGQLAGFGSLLAAQAPFLPERRLLADDAAGVERALRRWTAPGSAFPDAEAAARYRAAMSIWPAPHCALEYHRWAVRSRLRTDGVRFQSALRRPVAMPVLQVHGTLDALVLPRTAHRSRELVSGPWRFAPVAGAGHYPHEEAPEETSAALLAWLGELPDLAGPTGASRP